MILFIYVCVCVRVCVLFIIVIHLYIRVEGLYGASQVALVVKNSPCQCRRHKRQEVVQSLGHEDPWRRKW